MMLIDTEYTNDKLSKEIIPMLRHGYRDRTVQMDEHGYVTFNSTMFYVDIICQGQPHLHSGLFVDPRPGSVRVTARSLTGIYVAVVVSLTRKREATTGFFILGRASPADPYWEAWSARA